MRYITAKIAKMRYGGLLRTVTARCGMLEPSSLDFSLTQRRMLPTEEELLRSKVTSNYDQS
jgi:hypothetical protein